MGPPTACLTKPYSGSSSGTLHSAKWLQLTRFWQRPTWFMRPLLLVCLGSLPEYASIAICSCILKQIINCQVELVMTYLACYFHEPLFRGDGRHGTLKPLTQREWEYITGPSAILYKAIHLWLHRRLTPSQVRNCKTCQPFLPKRDSSEMLSRYQWTVGSRLDE